MKSVKKDTQLSGITGTALPSLTRGALRFLQLIIPILLLSCERPSYLATRNKQGGINWHSVRMQTKAEQDSMKRVFMSEILYDDSVPDFRRAVLIDEAKEYSPMNYNTFATYSKPYTVRNPNADNDVEKMAIWCTREATFLARIHKIHWNRMYFHNSSKQYLRDCRTGQCYYIQHCIDYPMDSTFWIKSIAGEWITMVDVYPPLHKECIKIDIMCGEKEPEHIDGTTGWARQQDYLGIRTAALQLQQSKMKFKETIMVR